MFELIQFFSSYCSAFLCTVYNLFLAFCHFLLLYGYKLCPCRYQPYPWRSTPRRTTTKSLCMALIPPGSARPLKALSSHLCYKIWDSTMSDRVSSYGSHVTSQARFHTPGGRTRLVAEVGIGLEKSSRTE